jgi:cysteine synthase A
MLPDTGERYLSTPLFEDVPAEMTEHEIELSKSTPAIDLIRQRSAAPSNSVGKIESEILAEVEKNATRHNQACRDVCAGMV